MKKTTLFFTAIFLLTGFSLRAQAFVDSCFSSQNPGTSFASTSDLAGFDSDLLQWTGSAWIGGWPTANITLPPPVTSGGCRAIWIGNGQTWTSGGEGFGLRLITPLVTGQTYSFTFTYVSHGFGSTGNFAPYIYSNNVGSMASAYLIGQLPSVGYSWTTNTYTFTATAAQNGHNWILIHNGPTGTSGMFINFCSSCSNTNPPPTCSVNLGADTTLCTGDQLILDATTPGATYTWQDNSTNPTFTVTSAGTYWVTVNNGTCIASDTIVVSYTPPPVLTLTPPSATICQGQQANLSASGGTSYQWSTGATTSAISVTPSSTTTYSVTATTGSCSASGSVTVTVNPPITATTSATSLNCFGDSNGSATVTPSGGTLPYSFTWSPIGGTGSTASNLPSGTYTVTITDSTGCQQTESVTVTQPAQLTAAMDSTMITCNGDNDGSVTATPAGGTPGYTYDWSPSGGTNATASNLSAGVYTVTVTDSHGCTSTQQATIVEPAVLTASVTSTNVSCNGNNDGTATATPSGGTPGYTYDWSPSGGTNATASGLAPNTYSCTITDAHGCMVTQTFIITEPPTLTASSTSSDISCNGQNNGTATVNVSGGSGTYTYDWTPSGGSAANANNLSAGTYTCTVTDSSGCAITQQFTITEPPAISVTASSTNISCNGGTNGTATVNASGGTGTLVYNWSPSGGTNTNATNLGAGTYTCTITDSSGCSVTQTVTVTEPQPLVLTTTGDSVCPGNSALVTANASGGTGPYTYTWPNGGNGSSQNVIVTQDSTINVTVTDANGCATSANADVALAAVPVASFTSNATDEYVVLNNPTFDLCFTNQSTNATIWAWNINGIPSLQQSPCVTVSLADSGSYCATLYVTSSAGCVDSTTECVTIGESYYSIPNVFTPNGDGINDVFTVTSTGMKSIQCNIYDRWGVMVYSWDSPDGYWDGKTKTGAFATDGTYYYVITLTDFSGKQFNEHGFVTLIKGQ